jgi:hypothetical protein
LDTPSRPGLDPARQDRTTLGATMHRRDAGAAIGPIWGRPRLAGARAIPEQRAAMLLIDPVPSS